MVQNRKPEKSHELWDAHPDPSLIRHRSQASFSILCTHGNNNHTMVIKKKSLVSIDHVASVCLKAWLRQGLLLEASEEASGWMPAISKCLLEAIQRKYATRVLMGNM